MEIKKQQFLRQKKQLQEEVAELLRQKEKIERVTAQEKKKHKERRKIFDDKDYNLMYQLQQSQKELNGLVMAKKATQTDKFLSENEVLNERIDVLENNLLNNQWKDHYSKIDKVHQDKTQRMEKYVKTQAKQHKKWLKDYNEWYEDMVDNY